MPLIDDLGATETPPQTGGGLIWDLPESPKPAAAPTPIGQLQAGNLDPFNRPVLHNPDGSVSTTSSMSFGNDQGEVLIPTVVNGVRLTPQDAIAHYQQSGEHLGIFDSPANADVYAQQLHEQQAQRMGLAGPPKGGGLVMDIPADENGIAQALGRSARIMGEQAAFGGPAAFMRTLDAGANAINDALGTPRGGAFGELANAAQQQVQTQPQNLGEQVTAGVASGLTGGLPSAAIATSMAGPVAGFAGLSALEAYQRGASPEEIGLEAIKGGFAGAAFGGSEQLTRPARAVAQGTIGAAQAAGGSPADIASGAASMAALGQLGGPGRLSGSQAVEQSSPTLATILEARRRAAQPEPPAPPAEPPQPQGPQFPLPPETGQPGVGLIWDLPQQAPSIPTGVPEEAPAGVQRPVPQAPPPAPAPVQPSGAVQPPTQPEPSGAATGRIPPARPEVAIRLDTGAVLTGEPGTTFHHEVMVEHGVNPGEVKDTGWIVNGQYVPQEQTAREQAPPPEGFTGNVTVKPAEAPVPFDPSAPAGWRPEVTFPRAIQLDTGQVIRQPEGSPVTNHDRLMTEAGINPDTVRSTGFIVNGTYLSQDGPPILEPLPGTVGDEHVFRLPLRDIVVDEKTFQTRRNYGVGGETGQLAHIGKDEIHDPSLGNLVVWKDPADGQYKLVDGHNRRALLERVGIPDARVIEIQAANPAEARMEGAYMNMRAGTFNAIDVATVMREGQITAADLRARGIDVSRGLAREGAALADLHPALWGMAVRGEMPLSRAATIGRELGGSPEAQAQQLALVQMLGRRRGELTDAVVAETIRQTQMAPVTTETQNNLFGEKEMAASLAVERAQVITAIGSELARDKRLFGYVGNAERAQRLGQEGTQVDTARAQEIAGQSAQVNEIFGRLANRQGAVSDVVNAAARAVASGQPVAEAVGDALPQVREAVRNELAPAPGGGGGVASSAGEGDQGAASDLFAGQQPGPGRLTSESGALRIPDVVGAVRNTIQRGRDYAARLEAEQADIAQQDLTRRLEAGRRRLGDKVQGTQKAPVSPLERVYAGPGRDYLGREFPQELGDLQSPGQQRDTSKLAPSIGDAFGDQEVTDILNRVGVTNRADIEHARRGVVSDRLMRARADELAAEWVARIDDDPAAIGELRARGEAVNAERATAILSLNEHYLKDFLERANAAEPGDVMAQLEALRSGAIASATLTSLPSARAAVAGKRLVDMLMQATGAGAEAGRALRAFRAFRERGTTPQAQALQVAAKLFNAKDPATAQQRLDAFMAQAAQFRPDDVIAMNRLLMQLEHGSLKEGLFEYMVNAYLSGPKGRMVDVLSNGIMAARRPVETMLSVPADKLISAVSGTPRERYAGQAVADATAMFLGIPDAMRRFARAMVTELPQSGSSRVFEPGERRQAISGPLGRAVRIPGSVTMAIDEAFKHLNSVGSLYSEAYRIPLERGAVEHSAEHIQSMADIIRHPERIPGLLEQLHTEEQYRTWQDINGPAFKGLMALRRSVPGLRYLIPFVRTPLALASQAYRDISQVPRTAFNLVGTLAGDRGFRGTPLREITGELPKGGQLAEQLSRTVVGGLLAGAIAAWALQGKITGAGPPSLEKKRELRATGWAPNSLKIGDQYVNYNRMDPLGMYVGVIADMTQAFRIGLEEEDALQKVGALFAQSASQNFVSKTYMKSVSDFLEGLRDPVRYFPSFVNNTIGGFIPVGVSQVARALDPTVRLAQTLRHNIEGRLPGVRENLFPLRDVFGREIIMSGGFAERLFSPFDRQPIPMDPATSELRRLEYAPGSPMRSLDLAKTHQPLDDKLYDQYVQESGDRALLLVNKLLDTYGYQHLPHNGPGDNKRRELLAEMFLKAREYGRAKVLPQIAAAALPEIKAQLRLMQLDIDNRAEVQDEPAAAINQ